MVKEYIESLKLDKEKRVKSYAILAVFVVLVAAATFWVLRYIGITMTNTAACGMEEHTHTEACIERKLICTLPEDENHTHTDECYKITYICGKQEHVHTVDCYPDPQADIETIDAWEKTLPQLGENRVENLIAIARSQIGYTESKLNWQLSSNGERNGYTRYGAWYGNEYADWRSTFVAFCLNYAGISRQAVPVSAGVEAMRVMCTGRQEYETGAYVPAAGDIAFIDDNSDGTADRVGIITNITRDGRDRLVLRTIEGDVNKKVAELSTTVFGYNVIGYFKADAAQERVALAQAAQGTNTGAPIVDAANTSGSGEETVEPTGSYIENTDSDPLAVQPDETPGLEISKVSAPTRSTSRNYTGTEIVYIDMTWENDPTYAGNRVNVELQEVNGSNYTTVQTVTLPYNGSWYYSFTGLDTSKTYRLNYTGDNIAFSDYAVITNNDSGHYNRDNWEPVESSVGFEYGSAGADYAFVIEDDYGYYYAIGVKPEANSNDERIRVFRVEVDEDRIPISVPNEAHWIVSSKSNSAGVYAQGSMYTLTSDSMNPKKRFTVDSADAFVAKSENASSSNLTRYDFSGYSDGGEYEGYLSRYYGMTNYYMKYEYSSANSQYQFSTTTDKSQAVKMAAFVSRDVYEAGVKVTMSKLNRTTPDDPMIAHDKKIDWLGDGVTNSDANLSMTTEELEDFYRLYLNVTGYCEPTDLLIVIDQSGSMEQYTDMTDSSGTSITRIAAVQNFLNGEDGNDGFIKDFLNANPNNKLAIETFSSHENMSETYRYKIDSSVLRNWGRDTSNVTLTTHIVTNYCAAMIRADDIFSDSSITSDGNRKVMVFISDGEPTFSNVSRASESYEYEGDGDEHVWPVYRQTEDLIIGFQMDHPEVTTHSVAFHGAADGFTTYFLELMAAQSGGEFFDATTSMQLLNTVYSVVFPTNVSITENLSDYVDYYSIAPNLIVTRSTNGGTPVVLWQNGAATSAGSDIISDCSYIAENHRVKLTFVPTYPLDPNDVFTVSFNVTLSDYAKEQYVANGYDYDDNVGDPTTDYGTNETSSLQPGFDSNNKAYITYLMDGEYYRETYYIPVVQTHGIEPHESDLSIAKTIDWLGDGESNPDTGVDGEDNYRLYLDWAGSPEQVSGAPKPEEVVITDYLSKYVALVGGSLRGAEAKITRTNLTTGAVDTIYANGSIVAKYAADYSGNDAEPILSSVVYTSGATDGQTGSTGRIVVTFASDYELDKNYNFTLSYNVVTTEAAYNEAMSNAQALADFRTRYGGSVDTSQLSASELATYNRLVAGYSGNTGDAGTDYGTNGSSSSQPGYRSNTMAKAEYTVDGTANTDTFKHPVVQVEVPTIPVERYEAEKNIDWLGDGGGNPDTSVDDDLDTTAEENPCRDLYRLYLDFALKTADAYDLLIMIDTSSSMSEAVSDSARYQHIMNALNGDDGLIKKFLAMNSDNQYAVMTFDGVSDSQLVSNDNSGSLTWSQSNPALVNLTAYMLGFDFADAGSNELGFMTSTGDNTALTGKNLNASSGSYSVSDFSARDSYWFAYDDGRTDGTFLLAHGSDLATNALGNVVANKSIYYSTVQGRYLYGNGGTPSYFKIVVEDGKTYLKEVVGNTEYYVFYNPNTGSPLPGWFDRNLNHDVEIEGEEGIVITPAPAYTKGANTDDPLALTPLTINPATGVDTAVLTSWTDTYSAVSLNISANRGANYAAALERAQELLALSGNTNKLILFITDGEPTYALTSSGARIGNGTETQANISLCGATTRTAIGALKAAYPDAYIRTVMFNDTSKSLTYLNPLDSTGRAAQTNDPEALGAILNSAIFPTAVTISDPLSEYVDYMGDLKIMKIKSSDATLREQLYPVPDDSTKTWEDYFTDVSYDQSGHTVSATFRDDYVLDPEYKYVLSFNVKANDTAYSTYEANAPAAYADGIGTVPAGYGNTIGDASTDFSGNATSSGEYGFYSNKGYYTSSSGSSFASFTYNLNGTEHSLYYKTPVVQVHPEITPEEDEIPSKAQLSVTKTWDDDSNANGTRPEYITVYLYADGVRTDRSARLTAPGWSYTFTDLEAYSSGTTPIIYSISEQSVYGYEVEMTAEHTEELVGYVVTPSPTPITSDHITPSPTPLTSEHETPSPTPLTSEHITPSPTPEPTMTTASYFESFESGTTGWTLTGWARESNSNHVTGSYILATTQGDTNGQIALSPEFDLPSDANNISGSVYLEKTLPRGGNVEAYVAVSGESDYYLGKSDLPNATRFHQFSFTVPNTYAGKKIRIKLVHVDSYSGVGSSYMRLDDFSFSYRYTPYASPTPVPVTPSPTPTNAPTPSPTPTNAPTPSPTPEIEQQPILKQLYTVQLENTLITQSLVFTKKSITGEALEDVEFELYPADSSWNLIGSSGAASVISSASDGTVSFTGLPVGNYVLVEKSTPEGYVSGAGPWHVLITESGTQLMDASGNAITIPAGQSVPVILNYPEDWQGDGYELPETGGRGVWPYIIAGSTIMAASAAALTIDRRKRRSLN